MSSAMLILNLPLFIGYLLGLIAFVRGVENFQFWILLSMLSVWWSRGAINTASQGIATGKIKTKTVQLTILMHWVLLIALYILCAFSLNKEA